VRAHRQRYRNNRKRSQIPTVALVGYTNAGKSTLLNKIANAKVLVADKLFATLDPTTRRVELPGGHQTLFTDTVGFIQKLPTQLIAAFRATLEEITDANLLLHIVDITHYNALAQWRAVQDTLAEIGADSIPSITLLNKIDRLPDPNLAQSTLESFDGSIAISAKTGIGLTGLLEQIESQLFMNYLPISVQLPYSEGQLISLIHEQGQVERIEHKRGGVFIQGSIPGRLLVRFQPFIKTN
jgi:GTP-binding protein HflX